MNDQHIKQTNDQTTRGGNNMFQTMKKRMKNEKGLTLIELLAVIVILAIIAAIAIPAIGNIITNSKYNAIKSDAMNILNAAQLAKTDNVIGATAGIMTVAELKKEGYLESIGEVGKDTTASVKMSAPLTLTAKVPFEGQTINFEANTVEDIKADNEKGSEIAKKGSGHTIKNVTTP